MLIEDFMFLIEKLQAGSVCVIPTDTIYGLVATAVQPEPVERIYQIKGRTYDKPFIILISDLSQLIKFSVKINEAQVQSLDKLWPAPVSVILPCEEESFTYLHRGTRSLAFRIPDLLWLRELVANTGPLIATSANKSGRPVTDDLDQIMKEIPEADQYIEGPVSTVPSKLARMQADGTVDWLNRN